MIIRYLEKVRKIIAKLEWLIDRETFEIEYDEDTDMGIIGGRLTFKDGSIFHFKEVLLQEKRHYRFHYINKENNLIFRFDSAPHHKEIKTFPYHVHLPNDIVKESKALNFIDVLKMIENIIIEHLEEN